jgi:hypothetical protein
MLSVMAVLFGLTVFVGGILWLWYMLAWPKPWARFTEAENAFWVRRGLPVKWVGACKELEQACFMRLRRYATPRFSFTTWLATKRS